MSDHHKQRLSELCAQAALEDDPASLLALVVEINRLLDEKDRVKNPGPTTTSDEEKSA